MRRNGFGGLPSVGLGQVNMLWGGLVGRLVHVSLPYLSEKGLPKLKDIRRLYDINPVFSSDSGRLGTVLVSLN